MAKHILYNAVVVVNSVDLSDHVESVSYVEGLNKQMAAAMSEVQDYSMPGTIVISSVTIVYYQDFAGSKVYATHHPLVANRTTFVLTVKADSAADSATNPNFTMNVFVGSHGLINGTRGDRHMASVTYEPAGPMTVDIT